MKQNLAPENELNNKNLKDIAQALRLHNSQKWEGLEKSAVEGLKDNEEHTIGFQRKGSHRHVVAKKLATWLPATTWKIKFA